MSAESTTIPPLAAGGRQLGDRAQVAVAGRGRRRRAAGADGRPRATSSSHAGRVITRTSRDAEARELAEQARRAAVPPSQGSSAAGPPLAAGAVATQHGGGDRGGVAGGRRARRRAARRACGEPGAATALVYLTPLSSRDPLFAAAACRVLPRGQVSLAARGQLVQQRVPSGRSRARSAPRPSAAPPRRTRGAAPGSSISASSARDSAATSSGGTSTPSSPSETMSDGPRGQSKLTTGRPLPIASTSTIPKPSKRELSTNSEPSAMAAPSRPRAAHQRDLLLQAVLGDQAARARSRSGPEP